MRNRGNDGRWARLVKGKPWGGEKGSGKKSGMGKGKWVRGGGKIAAQRSGGGGGGGDGGGKAACRGYAIKARGGGGLGGGHGGST